jgi:sec-independent protein translocase protein TatC
MNSHEKQMHYLEHLEEFRKRFIFVIIAFFLVFPALWPFSLDIIDLIVTRLCPPEMGDLYYSSPMELFFVRIKLTFVVTLIATSSITGWHIWHFISPAIGKISKKTILGFSLLSFICFAGGFTIAIFVIFPLVMNYTLSMQMSGVKPWFNVSSCISMVTWLGLGFGVCFQLPVIVLLLMKSGILSSGQITRSRPYVYVGCFIVSGLLTPPDIMTLLCMAVPTCLLFEMGLFFGKLFEKSKQVAPEC